MGEEKKKHIKYVFRLKENVKILRDTPLKVGLRLAPEPTKKDAGRMSSIWAWTSIEAHPDTRAQVFYPNHQR
jgi:hypothetical protein